jgi:hypothetical protein
MPLPRFAGRAGLLVALTVAAGIALARQAGAQGYPFSQRGTVTQSVAFTTIRLEYGRPVARGRELFGALVPWDSVWHPGADSASTIAFDRDVTIEGRTVPAGRYSLWMIPRRSGPWTVILSRAAEAFHRPYPGAAQDLLRLDVAPEASSHMESMAFYFPMVLRDDAVLRFHWGSMTIPLRIKAPYRPE